MSKEVTQFYTQYGIDPAQRNLEGLQHIAQICQKVISQDCVYPCDTFSDHVFDNYLEFIRAYAEDFLPHASSHLAHIPALHNRSALQYAALYGYDRYIQQLQHEPSSVINAQNPYGMSALHLAALQGHLACCQALCTLGASVTLENKQQQYPLYCVLTDPKRTGAASAARQAEVFRYLWQRDPSTIGHCDRFNQNALHLMAVYGHFELLEEAMQQDPELVRNRNTHGTAPIHAAIDNQQRLAMQTILTHVPEVAVLQGHKLRIPLHYAILAGDEEMVTYCCQINHSSEVSNARDTEGKTPWMMAYEVSDSHKQGILDILAEYFPDITLGYGR
ncbi:MAG: ankyrin repeat domain-containing protein [Gammaproteobacteria bacterium]|jgi:ankyrin repeat protein|nr:ankyrin repeat domain-containing protein [Gammaproteobacteria bacterium]